jgi:hypothetical protein
MALQNVTSQYYDKKTNKTVTVQQFSGQTITTKTKGDTTNGSTASAVQSSVSADSQNGGGQVSIPVYGATADINAAKGILGGLASYIDTTGWSLSQQAAIPQGSYIVGGEKAGGGVSVNPYGTTRIAGYDVQETASMILKFATGGIMGGSKASVPVAPVVKPITVLPSGTGILTGGVTSPSADTLNAISKAGTPTGINGTNTSVLSGLTFDNLVAVFVGIAFLTTILGLFKRGK